MVRLEHRDITNSEVVELRKLARKNHICFLSVERQEGEIQNNFSFQALVTKSRQTRCCNLLNGYLEKQALEN